MELIAERLGGFYPSADISADSPDFVVLSVAGRIAVDIAEGSPRLLPQQLPAAPTPLQQAALGYLSGVGRGHAWQVSEQWLEQTPLELELLTLRELVGRLDASDFALVSRASQLLQWQREHRFCGSCGRPTSSSRSDHALRCEPCNLSFYAKISPCIITLVERGDYCLLGRQGSWPAGLFSTLAGFIEPGESAEQALRREVMEESGIDTDSVRYFASQAWPFPSQLMLGYFARYAGGDIVVDGVELEAAQWFHYRELPRIPPPTSISGQLIRAFVAARTTAHKSV